MGIDFREWDELTPDVLALIFTKLSLRELLTVVPTVCKSWRKTVLGPHCWQQIDLRQWSMDYLCVLWPQLRVQGRYVSMPTEHVDRMLQILIPRTCGSLQVLFAPNLCETETVMLIAKNSQALKTFGAMMSFGLNDGIIQRVVPLLSKITTLDLSYCKNIGAPAIQSIGKHCKFLTSFYRVVVMDKYDSQGNKLPPQTDEAMAIATTMLRLKDLHIQNLRVYTKDVEMIVENCKYLEYLDITGCRYANLDDVFLESFPMLKIVRGCSSFDCVLRASFVPFI